MTKKRVFEVDFLRGIAIVLMVIFHINFNLNYFEYIDIDIYRGIEWKIFRAVIVSLFLLLVGVGLIFAYEKGINFKKLMKRLFILFFASLLITIATKIVFPNSWIYFGIIHFIFVASIVSLVFVGYPTISLVVGVAIIVGYFLEFLPLSWMYDFLKPLLDLPKHSEDLARFFPWFGVVLIGIFLGKHQLFNLKISQNLITQKVAIFGQYSLIIYLVHQPVLFGSLMGVDYISRLS